MENKIGIVGGGALGATLAAWMTSEGKQVVLYEPRMDAASAFSGGITVKGAWNTPHPIKPFRVAEGPQDMAGITRILFCVSAGYQEEAARLLLPAIAENASVLLIPGNLGSVPVKRIFNEHARNDILVAELGDACWPCRQIGDAAFTVALPISEKKLCAYPKSDTARVMEAFDGCLPFSAGDNILSISLASPNILAHVPGTIMNAMLIQQMKEQFAMFRDGLSETLIDCISLIEKERNGIFEALGFPVPPAPTQVFLHKLLAEKDSPSSPLQAFISLDGPSDFHHRYVEEDAPCGMAMLCSLGKLTGVETPVLRAFLTIISAINKYDYYSNGRTLENIGLPCTSRDDLLNAL